MTDRFAPMVDNLVEEDVAEIFVKKFKPELFEVLPDGSFSSPTPGETKPVKALGIERA